MFPIWLPKSSESEYQLSTQLVSSSSTVTEDKSKSWILLIEVKITVLIRKMKTRF